MVALQGAIGAVNDLADGARDAIAKPDKPIPAGLVGLREALGLAVGAAALGLVVAAGVGPAVLFLALAGLGVGLAYDLLLKPTAWSWLPLALGVALLPAYAWVGAGRPPSPVLGLLLAAAFGEGIALALGNEAVDLERDRASGLRTLAGTLGLRRTLAVVAVLGFAVVGLALGTVVVGVPGADRPAPSHAGWVLLGVGAVATLVAPVVLGSSRPAVRERGWELQAIGAALLAGGWLSSLGPAAIPGRP